MKICQRTKSITHKKEEEMTPIEGEGINKTSMRNYNVEKESRADKSRLACVSASASMTEYDSESNDSDGTSQTAEPSSPNPKKIKTGATVLRKGDTTRTNTTSTITSTPPPAPSTFPQDYLPAYLARDVQHSHSDFFISTSFDPRLIAQLMYEGFLPIATPRYLVPKLHKKRCVVYPLDVELELELEHEHEHEHNDHDNHGDQDGDQDGNPHPHPNIDNTTHQHTPAIHISKNSKKRSKKFLMTINKSFDQVVQGCHDQHGIAWLYPPIVDAFRVIHQGSSLIPEQDTNSFSVRLYSIEVWSAATGELVGGELGYATGSIYTSLTGFAKESDAGSVQLVALGSFLWRHGFEMWDFGMTLDYKIYLGAHDMPRHEFVENLKELRGRNVGLMKMEERQCCKRIILGGESKS